MEPPWEGGTKVYINGLGHMTKMAAMPIYGKNLTNYDGQESPMLHTKFRGNWPTGSGEEDFYK